jgi:outer membrane protein assembly factor BamE (lipoprotein component of BamABCDE complex)
MLELAMTTFADGNKRYRLGRPLSSGLSLAGISFGLVLAGLQACTPSVTTPGHRPDAAAHARVEPGKSTREQVAQLLGSPTAEAAFDENAWFYVNQTTETLSFYQQDTVEQEVVAISFDEDGRVEEIERHGLEQAVAINPVDRVTPTTGKELSVFEQFIGNIGRFNDSYAEDGPPGTP